MYLDLDGWMDRLTLILLRLSTSPLVLLIVRLDGQILDLELAVLVPDYDVRGVGFVVDV